MRCARCQHENRLGAKFCEECAAPLARGCANCGAQLAPTAKFCSECAHPAGQAAPTRFAAPDAYTPKYLAERILTSKAALEGERKQVSVLFADLKGSMELFADRDPEDARRLLDPVLERMMEAGRQCLELAAELEMRPELAHAHLGLARLLRNTRALDQAREHLRVATSMYREMDMRFWLEQAETAMSELGSKRA